MGINKRKIAVLSGEGIECEKESALCFSQKPFEWEVLLSPVPKILKDVDAFFRQLHTGDWVFIPGGFSFADHFGSGRLLSYQLQQISFFKKLIERGIHLLGVCNGFQVLCAAGSFGAGVSLLHNENNGKQMNFTNRWVNLKGMSPEENYYLPVRHGEGRLVRAESNWAAHVKPFLFYNDDSFENGSVDKVAGLRVWNEKSSIWGMMPHPEIARRWGDRPDASGPEFSREEIRKERKSLFERPGDGMILLSKIVTEVQNA